MKILKIIVVVIALSLLGLNTYRLFFTKDVVYVDIGKLVDSFKLKVELEKQSTANLLVIKNALDSMKLISRVSPASGGAVDSNIHRLETEFEKYYYQSNQEITKRVWDRLNPAIEDYGHRHHYRIIVGANGAGTILYGDKENDVTEDIIKYVNQSYEKGN